MADERPKRAVVTINGVDFRHVTNFDYEEDTSAEVTDTFDGPVPQGNPDNPYSISIERLIYEGSATYLEVEELLDDLRDNQGTVSLSEYINPNGEPDFTLVKTFHDCILDGRGHKVEPKKSSVSNLKFKAARMDRTVL